MTLNTPVGVGWLGTPVETREWAIGWPSEYSVSCCLSIEMMTLSTPLRLGRDVVRGSPRLRRGLLTRGHDQAVRLPRGVEGLVEGKGIRGCEASEQGGARCQ